MTLSFFERAWCCCLASLVIFSLVISTATITKSLVDSDLALGLVSDNLDCFSTQLVRNDIDELVDECF